VEEEQPNTLYLWPKFGPTDSLKGKWAKLGPQVAGPQVAILKIFEGNHHKEAAVP
jgi:hypothetical protein